MNLTLRARIFIIISIIVLIVLAVSITLIVISQKSKIAEETSGGLRTTDQQTQTGEQNIITGIQPTIIDQNLTIKPQTSEEKMRLASENIAKIFTERYGSYSTDNPGQNLKDLEILSTPDLWAVLKNKINATANSKVFIGVTTRAFSSSIISYETDKSVVNIISTREENKNGVLSNYNQEAEVTLVRSGNNWLVDNIKWK